eukprot:11566483-Alexandrium_andersonii.AAC.1
MREDDWELAQHDSPSGCTVQFAHQIKDGLGEFFICRCPLCLRGAEHRLGARPDGRRVQVRV